jgi:hypothetical protein
MVAEKPKMVIVRAGQSPPLRLFEIYYSPNIAALTVPRSVIFKSPENYRKITLKTSDGKMQVLERGNARMFSSHHQE